MASLGDLVCKVGADISGFTSSMQGVIAQLDDVASRAEKSFERMESAFQRLAVVGAEMSAVITIPILGLGDAALQTAAKFEQTQISFTHFLGNTQKAQIYLRELYDFAKTTPFQITALTDGAQKLMAMGFAANQVIPSLKVMGDQLSAVGRMEMLPNLILAFGELKEGGTAAGRALRQMVMDGVIPALKYMSEAAGISIAEMKKKVTAGAVDASWALEVIFAGMQKHTGGMMKEQMSSFNGLMTNIHDNIMLTLKQIGDQLLPLGKSVEGVITGMLEHAKSMAATFASMDKPMQMITLGMLAIAAASGPLLVAFAGLVYVVSSLATAWPIFAGLALAAKDAVVAMAVSTAELAATAIPAAVAAVGEFSVALLAVTSTQLANFSFSAIPAAIGALVTFARTAVAGAVTALATFSFTSIPAALGALRGMLPGIVAIQGALATLTVAASLAGAAFAGWKLGEWLRENIPAIQKFGDAVADLLLKIPGLGWAIEHMSGASRQAADAHDHLTESVAKMEQALLKRNIVIQRGNMDLDQYARKLAAAAATAGPIPGAEHHGMDSGKPVKDKLSDLEKSRAREIDGAVAHSKALIAIETDRIKYLGDFGLLNEAQVVAQTLQAGNREFDIERAALEKKKAIYRNDLAERQVIDNQIAALMDKNVLRHQEGAEKISLYFKAMRGDIATSMSRIGDEMEAEIKKSSKDVETARRKHEETMLEISKTVEESTRTHEESLRNIADKALQLRLDMGLLSKDHYLKLKQDEADEAYQIELAAIQKQRDLLSASFPNGGDEFLKRKADLDSKKTKIDDKHDEQTADIGNQKQLDNPFAKLGPDIFKSTKNSFDTALNGMIQGTQTFSQAWANMGAICSPHGRT